MDLAEELPLPLSAVGIGAPTCGGFQGAASTWPGPMWVLEVGTSRAKASATRPAPCQFPHELERMGSLTVEGLCAGPFWDVCCAAWCHWTLQVASVWARPSMAHSPISFRSGALPAGPCSERWAVLSLVDAGQGFRPLPWPGCPGKTSGSGGGGSRGVICQPVTLGCVAKDCAKLKSVSKKTTNRMPPSPTLHRPNSPSPLALLPAQTSRRTPASRLCCALCPVCHHQVVASSPHYSRLCSNVGAARLPYLESLPYLYFILDT